MAILRSIPKRRKGPSLRGRVMIDSFRGVLRVRKWPRKRGRPRSALQRWWVDWFVQANKLAKYADGMSQARAIAMTKGSGLYPRDVLLMAMAGRLYTWSTPDGWRWYSMAAIGDISESLDVLAQKIGSVLVRATDRWRPAGPDPAAVGSVLTYKGAAAPPIWELLSGFIQQQELAESPVTPDDTVSEYDFNVDPYASIAISLEGVGFAASDEPVIRLSTDGGLTYKAGASDYFELTLTSAAEAAGAVSVMSIARAANATLHEAIASLTGLRAGRALLGADTARGTTQVMRRSARANFAGPITHLRLLALSGNNFDAGVIRLFGLAGTVSEPVLPDPDFASVALLVGVDGKTQGSTVFTDESSDARGNASETGDVHVDQVVVLAGDGSMKFDGLVDIAWWPDDDVWHTLPLTVECRFQLSDAVLSNENYTLIAHWTASGSQRSFDLAVRNDGGGDRLMLNTSSNGSAQTQAFSDYLAGGWQEDTIYHAAATIAANGDTYVYLDGEPGAKVAGIALHNSTFDLEIGAFNHISSTEVMKGWIDEIRFTGGVDRYAGASYTPEAGKFPRS